MVAEVQSQTVKTDEDDHRIILRIGVPQKRAVLSELSEISLSLRLDQARELVDVLLRFAVENEFPEESVCFDFRGDNSKRRYGPLPAYVKRQDVTENLAVAARLTRTDPATNESALTMALEAPKQSADGVWHADVCVTSTEARLFAYMIRVNILEVKNFDLQAQAARITHKTEN